MQKYISSLCFHLIQTFQLLRATEVTNNKELLYNLLARGFFPAARTAERRSHIDVSPNKKRIIHILDIGETKEMRI